MIQILMRFIHAQVCRVLDRDCPIPLFHSGIFHPIKQLQSTLITIYYLTIIHLTI
uniref:Uncharacterized protein n=1 Tax=Arundo donax TaxID=35708 RepID=A0A0A9CGH9_ARUDO